MCRYSLEVLTTGLYRLGIVQDWTTWNSGKEALTSQYNAQLASLDLHYSHTEPKAQAMPKQPQQPNCMGWQGQSCVSSFQLSTWICDVNLQLANAEPHRPDSRHSCKVKHKNRRIYCPHPFARSSQPSCQALLCKGRSRDHLLSQLLLHFEGCALLWEDLQLLLKFL